MRHLSVFVCLLSVLWILIMLGACRKNEKAQDNSTPIARVNDRFLYLPEMADMLESAKTNQDSTALIKRYAEEWIYKNMLYFKADQYLNEQQKAVIEQQAEAYKEALMGYRFEEELLKTKLDTTLSDDELQQYYAELGDNFILNFPVVKTRYFICSKENKLEDSLRIWFRSNSPEDQLRLQKTGDKIGAQYQLDTQWWDFEQLRQIIPFSSKKPATLIQNDNFIFFKEGDKAYFVEITDHANTGEKMPIDYTRSEITKIAATKRRLEYLKNLKNNLFQEAIDKGEAEMMFK
ncbi:MAG: hypothetical protein IPL35_17515 [Sphingobacteriales bacterium]|nr:hypothetical protein [Sphingobacteriales bacterium]